MSDTVKVFEYGFRDVAALLETGITRKEITDRAAALLRVGDELLSLARRYASECGECGGNGAPSITSLANRHCPECADIRTLIAKAAP